MVLLIIQLFFAANTFCQRVPQASLSLKDEIVLPGVKGRIDHLAYNNREKLLYVAALGNNSVEVIDLKSKRVIHSLRGLKEPQGIRYIPETGSIVVANGDSGELTVFDAFTYKMAKSVKLGDDADNLRYDPDTKTLYAGYGNGAIAAVDAKTLKETSVTQLPGHPESFQADGRKIFVNVPTARLVGVIDAKQGKLVQKWKIKEAGSNFPMAIDQANHRLFIGCRHPAKLLVLDIETGKTVSSLDINGDCDDLFYDNAGKLIYISCGEGYIDIFKQADKDLYQATAKIKTRSGARTSFYIPELNQLVVAAPSQGGSEAQLMVYEKE